MLYNIFFRKKALPLQCNQRTEGSRKEIPRFKDCEKDNKYKGPPGGAPEKTKLGISIYTKATTD